MKISSMKIEIPPVFELQTKRTSVVAENIYLELCYNDQVSFFYEEKKDEEEDTNSQIKNEKENEIKVMKYYLMSLVSKMNLVFKNLQVKLMIGNTQSREEDQLYILIDIQQLQTPQGMEDQKNLDTEINLEIKSMSVHVLNGVQSLPQQNDVQVIPPNSPATILRIDLISLQLQETNQNKVNLIIQLSPLFEVILDPFQLKVLLKWFQHFEDFGKRKFYAKAKADLTSRNKRKSSIDLTKKKAAKPDRKVLTINDMCMQTRLEISQQGGGQGKAFIEDMSKIIQEKITEHSSNLERSLLLTESISLFKTHSGVPNQIQIKFEAKLRIPQLRFKLLKKDLPSIIVPDSENAQFLQRVYFSDRTRAYTGLGGDHFSAKFSLLEILLERGAKTLETFTLKIGKLRAVDVALSWKKQLFETRPLEKSRDNGLNSFQWRRGAPTDPEFVEFRPSEFLESVQVRYLLKKLKAPQPVQPAESAESLPLHKLRWFLAHHQNPKWKISNTKNAVLVKLDAQAKSLTVKIQPLFSSFSFDLIRDFSLISNPLQRYGHCAETLMRRSTIRKVEEDKQLNDHRAECEKKETRLTSLRVQLGGLLVALEPPRSLAQVREEDYFLCPRSEDWRQTRQLVLELSLLNISPSPNLEKVELQFPELQVKYLELQHQAGGVRPEVRTKDLILSVQPNPLLLDEGSEGNLPRKEISSSLTLHLHRESARVTPKLDPEVGLDEYRLHLEVSLASLEVYAGPSVLVESARILEESLWVKQMCTIWKERAKSAMEQFEGQEAKTPGVLRALQFLEARLWVSLFVLECKIEVDPSQRRQEQLVVYLRNLLLSQVRRTERRKGSRLSVGEISTSHLRVFLEQILVAYRRPVDKVILDLYSDNTLAREKSEVPEYPMNSQWRTHFRYLDLVLSHQSAYPNRNLEANPILIKKEHILELNKLVSLSHPHIINDLLSGRKLQLRLSFKQIKDQSVIYESLQKTEKVVNQLERIEFQGAVVHLRDAAVEGLLEQLAELQSCRGRQKKLEELFANEVKESRTESVNLSVRSLAVELHPLLDHEDFKTQLLSFPHHENRSYLMKKTISEWRPEHRILSKDRAVVVLRGLELGFKGEGSAGQAKLECVELFQLFEDEHPLFSLYERSAQRDFLDCYPGSSLEYYGFVQVMALRRVNLQVQREQVSLKIDLLQLNFDPQSYSSLLRLALMEKYLILKGRRGAQEAPNQRDVRICDEKRWSLDFVLEEVRLLLTNQEVFNFEQEGKLLTQSAYEIEILSVSEEKGFVPRSQEVFIQRPQKGYLARRRDASSERIRSLEIALGEFRVRARTDLQFLAPEVECSLRSIDVTFEKHQIFKRLVEEKPIFGLSLRARREPRGEELKPKVIIEDLALEMNEKFIILVDSTLAQFGMLLKERVVALQVHPLSAEFLVEIQRALHDQFSFSFGPAEEVLVQECQRLIERQMSGNSEEREIFEISLEENFRIERLLISAFSLYCFNERNELEFNQLFQPQKRLFQLMNFSRIEAEIRFEEINLESYSFETAGEIRSFISDMWLEGLKQKKWSLLFQMPIFRNVSNLASALTGIVHEPIKSYWRGENVLVGTSRGIKNLITKTVEEGYNFVTGVVFSPIRGLFMNDRKKKKIEEILNEQRVIEKNETESE